MTTTNRRRAPRIPHQLPLHLTHDEQDLITKTENVSASGAYCTVTRFLPLMTKLQIRLQIPGGPTIVCEAAVVRIEPPKPAANRAAYQVAVFFTDLSAHDRSVLAHYVQQHLQPVTPSQH